MIARQVVALGLSLVTGAQAAAPSTTATNEVVLAGSLEGLPLANLIAIASEVTREPFLFEPRDVDVRVTFLGTIGVPVDRFLEFFELVLRIEGFVVVDESVGDRRFHRIARLGQQARGRHSLKSDAAMVSAEELERLSDRSCLVTTECTFEHIPSAGLGDMICQYFTDSSIQSVRDVRGSRTLVASGVAREVAALLAMARRLDAEIGRSGEREIRGGREVRLDLEKRVAALEAQLTKLVEPAAAADR